MAKEKYVGVKFQAVRLGDFQPTKLELKRIRALIAVGKKYARLGFFDKNGGNLSVRTAGGILIKRTGSYPNRLKPADFVKIVKIAPNQVFFYGHGLPSSEARLHWGIYIIRKEINAVLHAHDRAALVCRQNFATIGYLREFAYGTLSSAQAVKKAAKNHDYIVQKNHGVVALGKNVAAAFELLNKYHDQFKKIGG